MNDLMPYISSVRWQDVVDIALISYILFRLYALFRGTYVFRVLVGLALLWLFQRIAASLGLILTSWAMQGIIAVGAIIIIVVFRNEIRSILQAKNLTTILWGLSRKTVDTPVEIVVESLYELARRRAGALVVFAGRQDLKEVIYSGVPWQGLVSREMILSIFWRDNPVHDGAAIIEGNKVTEVGVILPLTRRKDLPSYYGTRHRAAVGLAESTDALVVVVSEERGSVTVAKGSSIEVIKRKDELTPILKEHLGVSATQWSHLKRKKLEFAGAAFASILLIGSIWFSFTKGMDTLINLEIPVEYMNRDPGMEISDTSVNAVRLHLSGSGTLVRSMRPEQVKVRLDLSKAVVGSNAFTITQENITLPPGVTLKNVQPSSVEVTLNVPIKKELPVQVDWTGRLSENLILTGVKLDPERIEVIGDSPILEKMSTIYTEKVSLVKIEKTGKVTVKPLLEPASLKIAPGSKDKVTVEYIVNERAKMEEEILPE